MPPAVRLTEAPVDCIILTRPFPDDEQLTATPDTSIITLTAYVTVMAHVCISARCRR